MIMPKCTLRDARCFLLGWCMTHAHIYLKNSLSSLFGQQKNEHNTNPSTKQPRPEDHRAKDQPDIKKRKNQDNNGHMPRKTANDVDGNDKR